MNGVCIDCGKPLTGKESYYLEYRCEPCERDNHERIKRWREGGDDPDLDRLFDGSTITRH